MRNVLFIRVGGRSTIRLTGHFYLAQTGHYCDAPIMDGIRHNLYYVKLHIM